jgi:hypothetical protein
MVAGSIGGGAVSGVMRLTCAAAGETAPKHSASKTAPRAAHDFVIVVFPPPKNHSILI